ncbi:MAG: family N-acetyltransferase [Glaciihabitans sp.]|nr:family N-acetyltransferase [Glaciihabitans sp.]
MTAILPTRRSLTGRYITLEPLEFSHLPELFAAIGDPLVFAGGYGGGPAGYRGTVESFSEWAKSYYQWEAGIVFGVRVLGGPHTGKLIGTTTFGNIDLANESAEVGWTAYAPTTWGTQVNVEAKLLMLGLAFESGFGRVRIAADVLNSRSRRAIAGIGATFEGITRRDKPRADGTWRDTAVFSVIVDDWPRVLALLTERLAPYDGRPVLFRTPPTPPTLP